ncbi:MAG: 7-cyano-7-deazaguanine synthase [Betaproteobacteria bacterium]|nr:7-cyano-7-deazaguanine synthase [Betaproteobacteria bacterium]
MGVFSLARSAPHPSDIVRLAVELGAPLHLTWSCDSAGPDPSGVCDSCILP